MNIEEVYALTKIKGIGPKAILEIMNVIDDYCIDTFRDLDLDLLLNEKKLSRVKKIIEENLPWNRFESYIGNAQHEIYNIENKGIDIVGFYDEQYPQLLKMTSDAPLFLYCKGNLPLLHNLNNIAVVGTRQNTPHGKLITEKSVQFMCENNYTIVSGLALGIDAIAHQASLDSKGKTISVLVDVDNVQPSRNRGIADDILANDGLLVSEMPPDTKIIPAMFAKRDRIQSGLSLAVFPIETNIDGGTMHAVRAAIKENRLVYVPDVEKSGYPDKNIPQLGGIKHLIEEEQAIPYTKDMYGDILKNIEVKKYELLHPKLELKQGSLL